MLKAGRRLAFACALYAAAPLAQAQVTGLSADELEKRNAASSFVLSRHASFGVVRDECEYLLAPGVFERGARGWLDRNKDDLEAAMTWVGMYMQHLKTSDPALFQKASAELTASTSPAVQAITRTSFRRRAPTAETCDAVLRQFTLPQLDFQSMGRNPGYEPFGEFGETLGRFRAGAGYQPLDGIKIGYDQLHFGLLASLDAAQAFREAGDTEGARMIYVSLAQRGDGASAQTLGVLYMNPQYASRDDLQAYRWFYAAWSLADYEGLNAMGVMLRDGRGVESNPRLAWGAFLLATAAARNEAARSRAQANASRLESLMTTTDRQALACMTLADLDLALRKPVEALPFVRGRGIPQPQLRLGQVLRPLASGTAPCS